MVWQENVTQIVMLTNLMEGIKVKTVQPYKVENIPVQFLQFKRQQQNYNYYFLIEKSYNNIFYLLQNKCVKYWPDLEASMDCVMFTLITIDERRYAHYVIRRLKMTHNLVMRQFCTRTSGTCNSY